MASACISLPDLVQKLKKRLSLKVAPPVRAAQEVVLQEVRVEPWVVPQQVLNWVQLSQGLELQPVLESVPLQAASAVLSVDSKIT
tara:strand:+ start:430 stop:684 length:255 start_codon:yes stop_codon:yes gene_type:complete